MAVWKFRSVYCIDTLKRDFIDTNAYKLQASLSERVGF